MEADNSLLARVISRRWPVEKFQEGVKSKLAIEESTRGSHEVVKPMVRIKPMFRKETFEILLKDTEK